MISEERREKIENQIEICKQLLRNTDYNTLKFAEGALSESEFEEIKEKRQTWRDQINELEAELGE